MSEIIITPVTRGHIDLLKPYDEGRVQLCGWIFREDTPIDKIDITLAGKPWASAIPLHERPEVKTAFESVIGARPHISRSGFDVTAPLPERVEAVPNTIVEITPYTSDGLRLDPWRMYFCAYQDELDIAPQPPVHLQERIGGSKDFLPAGAQLVNLLLTYVGKYKSISQAHMILDWGCGCGRVITQMIKFVQPDRLHGCDIDSEAIDWDKQHIHGPTFTRIDPYPPTRYSDGCFDLVYGISVMTHLDEQTHIHWLKELKRITCPSAILALSVMGERLRATNMPPSLAEEFTKRGFTSFVPNYSDLLAKFSHHEYYRETYHSLDYIEAHWSRYFDVIEYVETKYQDVVVLRRRPW